MDVSAQILLHVKVGWVDTGCRSPAEEVRWSSDAPYMMFTAAEWLREPFDMLTLWITVLVSM